MIVLWRLVLAKHTLPHPDGSPPNLLSGIGASKYGGRWNHPGTPVVYASSSVALAAMEVFVHLAAGVAPPNHMLVRINIPDDIATSATTIDKPPADWQRIPAPASTREIGTNWARSGRSVLLRVPSVVIPSEYNYLLNPQTPEFARVGAQIESTFTFDPRMIAARS